MKELIEQELLPVLEESRQMGKWKAYEKYKDSGVEWLGEMPAHWEVRRLKYLTRLKYGDSLPMDKRVEGEIRVFGSNGAIGTHNHPNTWAPVIIIGRKGSFGKITFSDKKVYAIDTTYYIDQTINDINIHWLRYILELLKLDDFSEDSAIPGLSREYVYAQQLPFLSSYEQQVIVTFLDHQTARIRQLIAHKECLIELLQERRTVIINQAVTRGLDSNVEMRDSEVEWLGEIPAHWEVRRIKHTANILRGKFSHRPRNDPRFYDGPYPFIQTGDITSADKNIVTYQQTLNELGYQISKEFPSQTLVMAIAANVGDVAILQFSACFPDSIVGFVPQLNTSLHYMYYCFLTMKQEMLSTATINTQLNLNIERIGGLNIPYPPLKEQKQLHPILCKKPPKLTNSFP
jgi:type I restriction enzyme S subunit